MAVSLKGLRRVTASLPPRVLIYAPHGMGKTTLANEFPNSVFIQTEQGEGVGMELDSFGLQTSYDEIMGNIAQLYQGDHGYQTLVLDSLDKMEPLVWQATCEANKWDSIETPGYGKGYLAADAFWRDFVSGLNALRVERKMNVVLLAHSTVERFDDPRTTSYSRYDIRLHKRAQAILQDEVDFIAFINQEAAIKEEDTGFNKKRTHAEGGAQRWIYCEGRPSLNAKNRYNMPPKILYKKGEGYKALAKYFPGAVAPVEAPATAPEAEQQTAEQQQPAAEQQRPAVEQAAA